MNTEIITEPFSDLFVKELKAVFSVIYENSPCTVNLIANKCSMTPRSVKRAVDLLIENELISRYKGKDIPPKSKSQTFYCISHRLYASAVVTKDGSSEIFLYNYSKNSLHPIEFKVPDRCLYIGDTVKRNSLANVRAFLNDSFPLYKIIGVLFISDAEDVSVSDDCHLIDAALESEMPYKYTSFKELIVAKCLKAFSINNIALADIESEHCRIYSSSNAHVDVIDTAELICGCKLNEDIFTELTKKLRASYNFDYIFFRVPFICHAQLGRLCEKLSDNSLKLYVYPREYLDLTSLAVSSAFSPSLKNL